MMNSRPSFPFQLVHAAVTLILGLLSTHAAEPVLQLKDNDVWVMAGDSITAQRLHTNYIEAFYRAQHPDWHLHFRNSGIGGNWVRSVLERFDYDVAAWKPTIVSIELGMNDANGSAQDYLRGMTELIVKIHAIHAQVVLISSSPVEDGSLLNDWTSDRCENIHVLTEGLKKLAAKENVVFVDQYHPLLELWGQNRRAGEKYAVEQGTWPPKSTPAATPFFQAIPASAAPAALRASPTPHPKLGLLAPSLISLGGDWVHTGPVGQVTMAATILKGFKAEGAVSTATIEAGGKVVEATGCKITDLTVKDGKLSFTRLDERVAWPVPPEAFPAFKLLPEALDLSQYILRVSGLTEVWYRVSINGKPAATVPGPELVAGWNMTKVATGVLAERVNAITALLARLQGPLNTNWRVASKTNDVAGMAAAQTAIDQAEVEIQTAIQPVPLHFEIEKTERPRGE